MNSTKKCIGCSSPCLPFLSSWPKEVSAARFGRILRFNQEGSMRQKAGKAALVFPVPTFATESQDPSEGWRNSALLSTVNLQSFRSGGWYILQEEVQQEELTGFLRCSWGAFPEETQLSCLLLLGLLILACQVTLLSLIHI